jgi:hypothetical protein
MIPPREHRWKQERLDGITVQPFARLKMPLARDALGVIASRRRFSGRLPSS